jgi:methylmalonyl-CoA mutase N-terminal domain/subunit
MKRTQQIAAYESGVTNTIDPMAGSYYVEAMTDKIEEEASKYIRRIDDMGGMVEAIEQGYVQMEIQRAAYQYCKEVESGMRIVVGVNKFQVEEEVHTDVLKINLSVQSEQVKFLNAIRSQRSGEDVRTKLAALETAASSETNLMPPILDAVRAYASVGEICNTMREVFGEYKERIVV